MEEKKISIIDVIVILVVSINFVGDALRDALDPAAVFGEE